MDPASDRINELMSRERIALRALLIASIASTGSGNRSTDLAQLVAAAPIHALPAAAELHRVSGMVLRGLGDVEGVPDDVRRELEVARIGSALHHLAIIGALSQLKAEFDRAKLAWAVIKGPAVAALLYSEAGDRRYADLDVLVARGDFPAAMTILEDLGYQSPIRNWALAEQMMAGQIEMKVAMASVDLHWDLYYSEDDRQQFSLAPEDMIDRSRTIDTGGVVVPTLDPEDTLLTLAVHAARSGGHRLLWLKDIERSIAVDRPDLSEVVRRAQLARCGPPVGIMLDRARAVLGADVHPDVVRALAPSSLRAADRLATRLVHPVQMHDRDTLNRWLTRSMRSSIGSTLGAIPARTHRLIGVKIRPPAVNETDDPAEKSRYLHAVASSRTGR